MRVILFLCAILACFQVRAQVEKRVPVSMEKLMESPFPLRLTLPRGETHTIEGVQMKCFSAMQYQTVVRIGVMYGKLYDWRLTALGTMRSFELALASRDHTIASQKVIIKTFKDDRDWLTLRLKQSGKTILDQSAGHRYEKYIMWALIAVEAGIILVQAIRK